MDYLGVSWWGRARLRILVIEVVLALACTALAGMMLYQARVAARAQAIQQADNVASALQRDLERDVEVLDLALRSAAAGALLLEQHTLPLNLQRAILFDGSLSSTDFGSMFIANADGKVTFDSGSEIPRPLDYWSSPAFQAHRADPDRGLLLSLVPQSQLNNLPVVALTRRINHADGSFAGVAGTALYLSRFKDLFGSLQLGPRDNVVAISSDGHVIYQRNAGTRYFGADVGTSKVFLATRTSAVGVIEGRAKLDGILRLYAHRRLRNVGIEISVGLALDDVYESWRREAWIIGSTLGCLMGLAVLLAIGVRREFLRRERAELAVRASERDFRLLADHGSDMVCRVGPDGNCRYISPAAIRLIGLPPEQLHGMALLDRINPADRPLMEAGAKRMLQGISETETDQFRIRHEDGTERWIETVGSALWDQVTGTIDGFVCAWRDVTDRKQAEALLAESEARYRLLADNATDLITCLDLNLRRTYVSPASVRVLGLDPAEMLGVFLPDVLHPDDAPGVHRGFRRLLTGASDHEIVTNRLRHKAGHDVWVEAHLSLLRDVDTAEPYSILCMLRDISERKAAADELQTANAELQRLSRHLARARDAAERSSRAKSRFLASVSHELRTPLNGILGYAELLRLDGGLSETQSRRVEAMLTAGSHLLNMVTCVLDLSEIETGKIELRPAAVALLPLASECLEVIRPAADAKGLSLTIASAPGVPQQITIDPMRLRQILLNLLGNAVKFTDRGAVSLVLDVVGDVAGDGLGLRIEVVDTGPGIPLSRRDRLFRDFDRLGIEATRSVEGAGLGLALSHRLAIALGGSLDHEDGPDGGSIFRLDLPGCAMGDAPPMQAAESPASTEPASPGCCWRVLVVDDVAINRDIAASFLRVAGHDCSCAEGGREAVEAASDNDFDVILMDMRMPEMDGLEATRRIRRLAGSRGKVPIVALTAQVFAEEVAACREAGVNDHLAKPFNQSSLLDVIRRATAKTSAPLPVNDESLQHEPPSPPLPLAGAELPTLDPAALQQTAAYLPKDRLASHLRSLAERITALVEQLGPIQGATLGATEPTDHRSLAAPAHALSGSASMFGFIRLAALTRQFELAADSGSTTSALTAGVIAACEAALAEIEYQTTAPAARETMDAVP